MTILYSRFVVTGSDITSHIKWAVSLVIADVFFNLPKGFVWVYNILTLLLHS